MSAVYSMEEKELTQSTDSHTESLTCPRATFNNRKYNQAKWVLIVYLI